jgi:acetolactate synthase-1/2/3 large subunit
MAQLTGGQALAQQLVREGVEVIFGLPGDQMMHALDGLYDVTDRIRFLTTRHEQATTFMADGYARAAGRPGVAFVVPGVGVYNSGAGMATAYATSSPVLQIAGQVVRDTIGRAMGSLHEVHEQLDLVRPVTKWQARALRAVEIPTALHEAFRQMATGRPRPTHVEAPPEAFAETAEITLIDREHYPPAAADLDQIREAAQLLAKAERPLIVAGGGAVLGDATDELRELAELLQAPVVMTREGKGAFDDRHPLALGVMWTNPRVAPHIADADVIVAVGTRFAGIGAKAPTRVIQIDVDVNEIGRQYPNTFGLCGDARLTVAALRDELDRGAPARASRAAEVRASRAAIIESLRKLPQCKIAEDLRAAMPDDTIVVPGTTTVGYISHMRMDVYLPRTYIGSSYMGTLGFSFPTALGAKVARPDRPVVSINGDGGFLYCATELATAKQHGINVVALVFNDGAFGNSNRDQRDRFGGREIGTVLQNPNFAKLAESFGADGMQLKHADDIGPALKEALGNNRTTVIEIPIPRLPSPFVI